MVAALVRELQNPAYSSAATFLPLLLPLVRDLFVGLLRAPRPRAKRASTLGVFRRTLVRLTAALVGRLG